MNMKNISYSKKILALILLISFFSACEKFLNRPTEDSYTIDSFYKTDDQCFQAANVLYSAPWYDFQRGWVKIGDVMAGNIYYSTDVFFLMLRRPPRSTLSSASSSRSWEGNPPHM